MTTSDFEMLVSIGSYTTGPLYIETYPSRLPRWSCRQLQPFPTRWRLLQNASHWMQVRLNGMVVTKDSMGRRLNYERRPL